MNRKLIRANLALAKGERAEAERLLRQMREEGTGSNPERRALMLWLDAQAQHDRVDRIRKLYDLINSVEADNPYSQLAREYLQEEARYAEQESQSHEGVKVFGVAWWKVALFAVVTVILLGVLAALLSTPSTPEEVAQGESVTAQATISATGSEGSVLPDRSRPLVADGFTARYERGILQIAAIEEDSARVMSVDGEALITPVEGARFYALHVYFECRQGICNTPPEASVFLRLDDETLIAPEENAVIAGARVFAPIALGRTTQGWLIFEIPVINAVSALIILPTTADRTTPQPLIIPLEAF